MKIPICELKTPAKCEHKIDGKSSNIILCGRNELESRINTCQYRSIYNDENSCNIKFDDNDYNLLEYQYDKNYNMVLIKT